MNFSDFYANFAQPRQIFKTIKGCESHNEAVVIKSKKKKNDSLAKNSTSYLRDPSLEKNLAFQRVSRTRAPKEALKSLEFKTQSTQVIKCFLCFLKATWMH